MSSNFCYHVDLHIYRLSWYLMLSNIQHGRNGVLRLWSHHKKCSWSALQIETTRFQADAIKYVYCYQRIHISRRVVPHSLVNSTSKGRLLPSYASYFKELCITEFHIGHICNELVSLMSYTWCNLQLSKSNYSKQLSVIAERYLTIGSSNCHR